MTPTDLPIESAIPAVRSALADAGHVVLVAPPGSGKTTIVPLRLLDEPWLDSLRIVVLEPRRLATRAAAHRMAYLLGESVGDTVGYVVRGDRRIGRHTRIEVVTEGVLTRRLQRDPSLPGVGVVIFDEMHERNLQTDIGLALALEARSVLRPDLRIVAMSATIASGEVAALLGGDQPAPIVESGTRAHPVDVRWDPPPRRARHRDALEAHVAAVTRSALSNDPGDVLVFLPGMGEIVRIQRMLQSSVTDASVRILHGSLPSHEQDAAIAPSRPGERKVVLSTDIAETSLTVEGIRIVIDSGLARAPRHDVRTGLTRLLTINISRASADQRSGRAGRTDPGVAYRLWSKLEHASRRPHIEPEITSVDLVGMALELAAWGTTDPATLRFLDQPPQAAFDDAVALLQSLDAIDTDGRITSTGRSMSDLPVHPRLAHMVVAAGLDQKLACVLAALVDERDILSGRPSDLPVDVATRVRLIEGRQADHPQLSRGRLGRVRRNADDLIGRSQALDLPVDPDRCGQLLALAYPDRLAIRRGSPGRFQLRTGTTAFLGDADPLAMEQFLIVPDLDGKRKDARIRLAAPIETADVTQLFADEVTVHRRLIWERDRLTERIERRLGGITLDVREQRPDPGDAVDKALAKRLRERRLEDLPWTDNARSLRERVAFLNRNVGDPWPDWSIRQLAASTLQWLFPVIGPVTGLDDLGRIPLTTVLRGMLGHRESASLDRLAPTHVEIPSGRRIGIDYSSDQPVVSVRVQEMFGVDSAPRVGGRPVQLELLSPAGRPLQITSDLASFWSGAWEDVRKEMAGRYPKHDWPADPVTAVPTAHAKRRPKRR